MRRPSVAAWLVLGLPLSARAINLRGQGDIGYSRTETWAQSYDRITPFDFGLVLGAAEVTSPGLFEWSALGSYRNQQTSYTGARLHNANIGFNGSASLLSGTILPLNLFASRTTADFSSDAAIRTTGSTVATVAGGTAVFRQAGLPTLQLNLQRILSESSSLTGIETETRTTILGAALGHTVGRNSVQLSYDTAWNGGTLADAAYRSHAFGAQLTTQLTDTTLLRFYDRYFMRVPTQDNTLNPRYDDNNLGAGIEWRPFEGFEDFLNYGQRHFLMQTPGLEETETLSHQISDQARYRWSEDLRTFATATFAYGLVRLGETRLRSTAETAGLGGDWQKSMAPFRLGLNASATGGTVQDINDGSRASYGGTAGGTLGWAGEITALQLAYSANYTRNGVTLRGFTLGQRAYLSLQRAPNGIGALRAMISANIDRSQDDLLGTSRNRGVTGFVEYSLPATSFRADAGITDGLSARLVPATGVQGVLPPVGGVPLPTSFNQTQRYATASVTQVLGHWRFTALARTLTLDRPDQPTDTEHSLGATASYVIGLFTFSAEDRVSVGRTDGTGRTTNYVGFRISRSFGGSL